MTKEVRRRHRTTYRSAAALAAIGAGVWLTSATTSLGATAAEIAAKANAEASALHYGPPITGEQAKQVIAAAEAEARRRKVQASIAVVEPTGDLVAFLKQSGARYSTPEIAIRWAKSAAYFRRSTKSYEDQYEAGDTGIALLPNVQPFDGGVLIISNGAVIGAVGVAGGSNEAVAKAGAAAIK